MAFENVNNLYILWVCKLNLVIIVYNYGWKFGRWWWRCNFSGLFN